MFKNPFSFDGRIRRTEYGLTYIIYAVGFVLIQLVYAANPKTNGVMFLVLIPLLWLMIAQSAKRCHDVGNSGWWQFIPLYALWLLFQDGTPGQNQYGINPKDQNIQSATQTFQNPSSVGVGYSGGYNGGHNAPGSSSPSTILTDGQPAPGDYKPGDLYR